MAAELTIEELAAESGMTARKISAHQARGLVAPPEVRMRVGYYGAEHVVALRLIAAAFVRLFVADIWREFEQDGMPIERRTEVDEAIDRLRQLAAVAAFARRLNERIEDAFAVDRERANRQSAGG